MADINKIFNLGNFQGKTFAEYLAAYTSELNYELFSLLENEGNPSINSSLIEPFNNYIKNAGKRHRPLLCILGCLAFGGDAIKCIRPACAIELFHNSALIHDDIVDKSEMRHGQKCLNKQIGQELAINVGDYGYYFAEKLILDSEHLKKQEKLAVLHEFTDMALSTIKGQAMDISWDINNNFNLMSDDYLQMAERKTAYYSCAVPLVIGAICAGANPGQVEALRKFGIKTGLAYQIQDDLLYLLSNQATANKDLASDIKQGKRTFVLLKSLQLATKKQRARLIEIINSASVSKPDIMEFKEIQKRIGALDESILYINNLITHAKSLLNDRLQDSRAKELLLSMADWCKDRLQ
ncbi:MAG: polyprenyl synthetase family protein [Eggerthellaceae bacterium]|nr:polyprenyl synthetase family protein [Eggerthellaceae bacterium]